MPKVFISHSWEDNKISRKIAHDLKRDGAEIWIDYARISAGESLPERISLALEWCDTLVLVWSHSAANSKWVTKEWTSAFSLDKTIIPCLLDDTKLPAILCSLFYINFKNADTCYNELCRALNLQTPEEKKESETEKLKFEQERLQEERKEKERPQSSISTIPVFRNEPTSLSDEEVKAMLKKNEFFDSYKNEVGKGFDNQFETKIINGQTLVIDHASGLTWQQSGSGNHMSFEDAKKYI